ncbi:BTB/POZ domain-containing protein At3g56230-like [Andrographis paniculata]|uniref:BTB/POZ domain-containing protein At3g56230-like n=1 Tax=Andrographis paniculata TaxID=175694 RepID=UPI0021E70299|nr:BTB/POZ domain-containing protein At3g56230-like [Andrographis paniculata]
MDCSICSALPYILRPPRNTICAACYEGARSIITLTTNKQDTNTDKPTTTTPLASTNKGFANALKWVKEMKELEEELQEKIGYLSSFGEAFRHQMHADIHVKPGLDSGPPLPAHRALLATRSEVFKNILESDECKGPPATGRETITLAEMRHEEVEALLEFLYSGSLSKERAEKHVYALSVAADKYQIPFLHKFCEHHMLASLSSRNALDIVEIADRCSNESLKDTTLSFIVRNMEDVVFSPRFDDFALKNPHLTVQITRASFMDIRSK